MWRSRNLKTLLSISAVGLLVGVGLLVSSYFRAQPVLSPPASFEPYRATLSGTYVCLPHTDMAGPHTLECALGLQADDGFYYALDFNLSAALPSNIPTGARVRGDGMVTPIENLSSDHWHIYPIRGIFSVTDSFEIL